MRGQRGLVGAMVAGQAVVGGVGRRLLHRDRAQFGVLLVAVGDWGTAVVVVVVVATRGRSGSSPGRRVAVAGGVVALFPRVRLGVPLCWHEL